MSLKTAFHRRVRGEYKSIQAVSLTSLLTQRVTRRNELSTCFFLYILCVLCGARALLE